MYEREIFLAALDRPAPDRRAFVANICADNDTLRGRVEALLAEEEQLAGFLETPAVGALPRTEPMHGPGGTELVPHLTEQPGDRIGRYKLLQKIGEGGCGVVYMAEQQEPVRRRVALKIIRLGMDTRSVIARFEAERQALAMMDHPNIARVYDAGATETGRPFFVMELVRGIRITEYCDQNNLPTEQRLNLFVQVCQAIQHAHQKGIIHRDIKPSNILVTLHDGVPVPKVIDFGIAKATEQRLTEKTLFTEFAAFIGTPAYMSPEQAEMSGLDIDTRSDVYSLGVLLYELLTGKTPFDPETLLRAGLDGCRRTIREQEPERPSTRLATMVGVELTTTADRRRTPAAILLNELRGDLDWIVMMALEKDRTRRYATASDLAGDVRRYLANDAVQARPPSNYYRFQKAVRRNRVAFAAAGAVAAALIIGVTISVWQAIRATDAEHTAREAQRQESVLRQQAVAEQQRAETERSAARLNEYIADINLAQQSLTDGNYGRAVQLLNKHLPKAGEPDLRGFEWRYLWHVSQGDEHTALPKQDFAVQSIAISPDRNLLALGGFEKIAVFDLRNRSVVRTLAKGGSSVAFLPDGKSLLTLSVGGTLRTWDTTDWSEKILLREVNPPFALSHDRKFLAAAAREGRGRDTLVVWDTETWQSVRSFPGASAPTAFSPDGRSLAMATREGIVLTSIQGDAGAVVLENSTNVFVRGPGPWARAEQSLAFTPDGSAIIVARNVLSERGVFVLSIWDARTGKDIGRLPESVEQIEHTGVISSIAFSPDGQTLATASMDHSIRLWDFKQRKRIATLHGHVSEVWALAFAPDGKTILTGGKDGSVKLWDTQRPQKEDAWSIASLPLAFSRDGHKLAALNETMDKGTGGREATVVFVNMRTGEVEERFPLDVPRSRFRLSVAISDDLSRIAHTAESGVRLVNTETGEAAILGDRRVDWVEISPNGQDLISFDFRESRLRWWDVRAGTNFVVDTEAFRVRFSPDGTLLAAFGRSNIVEVWNVRSRSLQKRITLLDAQTQIGPGHTFSGDSRFLAVGFMDGSHRMYEVATGKLVSTFTGHKQGIGAIAFSPDGKTLATASDDSTVRLWNIQTQQELITDRRLGGAVQSLMFSPDGQTLVAGTHPFGGAGSIRLYRAPAPKNTDLARY